MDLENLTIEELIVLLKRKGVTLQELKKHFQKQKKQKSVKTRENQEEKPQFFSYNKNFKRRNKLLGISGGYAQFSHLTLDVLEKLLKEEHIDSQGRQNSAPSVDEFYQFMKKYPKTTAHGYAIGPQRRDYRISIEGLEIAPEEVTPRLKKAFLRFCKEANELSTENGLWSWWT